MRSSRSASFALIGARNDQLRLVMKRIKIAMDWTALRSVLPGAALNERYARIFENITCPILNQNKTQWTRFIRGEGKTISTFACCSFVIDACTFASWIHSYACAIHACRFLSFRIDMISIFLCVLYTFIIVSLPASWVKYDCNQCHLTKVHSAFVNAKIRECRAYRFGQEFDRFLWRRKDTL